MMGVDNNHSLFHQQPLMLDWDLHYSFALGDAHHDLSCVMPLDVESPMLFATGYLEDAVACKRRRVASSSPLDPIHTNEDFQNLLQWQGSTCLEEPLENLNCLVEDNSSTLQGEDTLQVQELPKLSENCSDKKDSHNSRQSLKPHKGLVPLKDTEEEQETKKKKAVVYPFAVVKPVGLEGDVTLEDINKRILMRPTRPVKHPVGEFAFRPCVSVRGPGLSGKAVVGLTRIHTQGKGTITIIRTRG